MHVFDSSKVYANYSMEQSIPNKMAKRVSSQPLEEKKKIDVSQKSPHLSPNITPFHPVVPEMRLRSRFSTGRSALKNHGGGLRRHAGPLILNDATGRWSMDGN